MQAVILDADKLDELFKQLEDIQVALKESGIKPQSDFIDNVEFANIMRISKRTAQSWRDEGLISFSQIGSKIYYQMTDIQNLLDRNRIPSFKTK